MNRQFHKNYKYLCLFLILFFFNPYGTQSSTATPSEEIITYALPREFQEYSVFHMNSYGSAQWMSAVYSGLIKKSSENYNWARDLADLTEISSDGLTYTFNLKENLKFSNGESLESDDVEFSLKVAVTPRINIAGYSGYVEFLDNNSFIYLSETSFTITLLQSFNYPYAILSFPLIPRDAFQNRYNNCLQNVESECDWNSPDGSDAIGSGPFKVESINQDSVELVANPYWYNADQVSTDKIVFKSILNKQDAIEALISGDVDILDQTYGFTKSDVSLLAGIAETQVADSDVTSFFINHKHPYFGTGNLIPNSITETNQSQIYENARLLRYAMSLVVPRQNYIDESSYGYSIPAATMLQSYFLEWDKNILADDYDVSKARELLTQLGFDFSSLGSLNSTDQYTSYFFDITLITRSYGVSTVSEYSTQLAKIGIGSTMVGMAPIDIWSKTYLMTVEPPLYNEGGFDMIFSVNLISFASNPHWNSTGLFEHSGSCASVRAISDSCINFYNFDLDETMSPLAQVSREYMQETDIDTRMEKASQLQRLIHHWLPTIPVINTMSLWAWKGDIIGLDSFLFTFTNQEWFKVSKVGFENNIKISDSKTLEIPENLGIVLLVSIGSISLVAMAMYVKGNQSNPFDLFTSDEQRSIISEIFNTRSTLYYYLVGQNISKNNNDEIIEKAIPQDIFKFKFLLNPVRLSMMKLLNETTQLTSIEIKQALNISWNGIKTHLSALKERNYVSNEHRFIDESRKLIVSITPFGSEQYQVLMNLLHLFLDSTVDIDLD